MWWEGVFQYHTHFVTHLRTTCVGECHTIWWSSLYLSMPGDQEVDANVCERCVGGCDSDYWPEFWIIARAQKVPFLSSQTQKWEVSKMTLFWLFLTFFWPKMAKMRSKSPKKSHFGPKIVHFGSFWSSNWPFNPYFDPLFGLKVWVYTHTLRPKSGSK